MTFTENALNILTLKSFKGVGRAWIIKNIKGNERVEVLVSLLNNCSKENHEITVSYFERKREQIKTTVLKLDGFADGLVALGDSEFPPHRGNVKFSEQPILLFYRGDLSLLKPDNKNIAVIGLLNPDGNIKGIEQEVVAKLVAKGATIVSGLALGCDTIAHEQAVRSNGKTIAILPGPLNNIMPASNKELANDIVRFAGLLISEYSNEAKSKMELGGRYQERDRLQALYSDSIILTASYTKNNLGNDSGSRHAMEYAKKYAIPRAVIYNATIDENNPQFELNRQLMEEQKDIYVIEPSNIISDIKKILDYNSRYTHQQYIQKRLF
ncbi:DNA-processing protein DprA [Mangrovibacterium diazotrophicum]|uniref:DNA processing protein n=1 Tax=Mangrovibacterium diazotrophicum TaxID=1261403 RepID=A0A419W3H5_9BACT|nr:DNA-processing protein DprA [Mangrovibacterium diazotrophicum]RKD90025.1 DNA processing protein [Mangrovibacterium diazotrophicum]